MPLYKLNRQYKTITTLCHNIRLFEARVTLNLHLVTTTNFNVWSFPKISSLHKMSSCEKTTKEQISEQLVTSDFPT